MTNCYRRSQSPLFLVNALPVGSTAWCMCAPAAGRQPVVFAVIRLPTAMCAVICAVARLIALSHEPEMVYITCTSGAPV